MAPCFYNFNSCTRAIGKTSGFQNPPDCHWMVAGVELKKYVTGRAMSNRRSLSLHSRPGLLWAYLNSKLIGVVIQSPFKKLLKSQLYLFDAYSLDQPSGISYIGWQHLTTYCPLEVHIEIQVRPQRDFAAVLCCAEDTSVLVHRLQAAMISWRRLSFQRTTHATWTWCLTAQHPFCKGCRVQRSICS